MKIQHIDDLYPHVKDKAEIIRIEKDGYTVLDYVYQDDSTFDSEYALECRGIKFDSLGRIIARPFRKFFNYGEKGTVLDLDQPHTVMEKLDGSMVHSAMVDGKMYLMTRKGHTDVARQAEELFLRRDRYWYFLRMCHGVGVTPLFEYVGPDNRIVLRYDEPRLVLLGMRHLVRGDYVSRKDVLKFGYDYGIEVVGSRDPITDLNEFLEHTNQLEDAEGYVVAFDNGHMVKVKALDYLLKHRALDDLGSKKKVTALCAQGFMDDVVGSLPEKDAAELREFNAALQWEINDIDRYVQHVAGLWKDMRKEFALGAMKTLEPRWLSGLVFAAMDGKDTRALTIDAVIKHCEDLDTKWRGE